MKRSYLKKLFTLLASSLLILATDVFAAENLTVLIDQQGFCASLPQVDRETLTQSIQDNRGRLAKQQSRLSRRVEKLKFDRLDAIITLVMPGGLIYAAIKKGAERQERQRLELVKQELSLLNGDLLALSPEHGDLAIAFK